MSPARVTRFGALPDGRQVQRIAIARDGLCAQVLTYGAILQDLRLDGVAYPLVLGWPRLADYLQSGAYFGAIVGRFANRIAQGRFRAGGRWHQTDRNFRGRHTLHGGRQGSDKLLWSLAAQTEDAVTLTLEMPDGQMGFPGNLGVEVTYAIRPSAVLEIVIEAHSDQETPCSFAPHNYFILDGSGSIRDHQLEIAADHYLPVDGDLIPTGVQHPVAGTGFDFRQLRAVGDHPFDHNLCLSSERSELRQVGRLMSSDGLLGMSLHTTEPGLQIYTNSQFDEPDRLGLQGGPYQRYGGLALEPQVWPDAMNQTRFPDAILTPDRAYRSHSQFRFQHLI
ncbi:galactose mutarotase [Ruegeria sp. 2012CJ41-6]|uniref:Aldose 1-epimerase n=1 Tax=Ruegeria spongiae TaxID=2942209 RepID=A0ABT0PY79_9RHOB|nr:aldose epimerase family protein [Ruegeria spongiae]MCL6282545.1 galactose mutarotase [Ruegeria spongiae]